MNLFLRLLRYSKPYHHYLPEYIVYIVFYTIFGLLNFALIIPLLDFLFSEQPLSEVVPYPEFSFSVMYFETLFKYYAQQFSSGENKKFELLVYITVILLIVTLLKNIFNFLSQKVLARMRVNLVRKLRNALFEKMTNTSLSFFHHKQKGHLLSTMSSDLAEIETTVVSSIQTILKDPLMIIATFGALFYLSPQLTLFTLFFFPLSGYFISTISRKLRRQSTESQYLLGRLMTQSEEMISGNRVIKIFNAESFVQKQYHQLNEQYSRLMKRIIVQKELATPLSEVLGVLVICVIILYGGSLVLSGDSGLTASMFIGYLGLYFSIISPAKNITTAITNLQRGLVSGRRVFDLLDEEDAIKEAHDALSLERFDNEIRFDNVSFSYGNEVPVLKNVNLVIPKGKTIALVGESGAGKSTVADLIPRFYDASSGVVTIDGIDLKALKPDSLRRQMSMVTQEAILFNDTVYNNIVFGNSDVNEADVIQAAKIANAHNFIVQLDEGYQTMVGDRGMRLSGGQRQRLTIARAILKDAPIIIMDEATSALDTESERLVQEAITHMMTNRTSIVIAHRLSTIRHADEIIVMHNGEIVERGSHQELMALDGFYNKLVAMQNLSPTGIV